MRLICGALASASLLLGLSTATAQIPDSPDHQVYNGIPVPPDATPETWHCQYPGFLDPQTPAGRTIHIQGQSAIVTDDGQSSGRTWRILVNNNIGVVIVFADADIEGGITGSVMAFSRGKGGQMSIGNVTVGGAPTAPHQGTCEKR